MASFSMHRRLLSTRRKVKYSARIRNRRLLAVQKMLNTKGLYLSLAALRKVPKPKLVRYIQRNFTPEEVAEYLPVRLVFKHQDMTSTEENLVNVNPLTLTPRETTVNSVLVKDINHPIEPSQEITSTKGELLNQAIFAFEDDHPFDPGIWETLPQYLPQNYAIPDLKFVSVLKQAEKKYGTFYVQQQTPYWRINDEA